MAKTPTATDKVNAEIAEDKKRKAQGNDEWNKTHISHWMENVVVIGVEGKKDKNDGTVKKIILHCKGLDITWSPKKAIAETSDESGFLMTTDKNERYSSFDFVVKYPFFRQLQQNCTKYGMQEVVLSYTEWTTAEGKVFNYMNEDQATNIYYPEFDAGNDKLLAQEKLKKESQKRKNFFEEVDDDE